MKVTYASFTLVLSVAGLVACAESTNQSTEKARKGGPPNGDPASNDGASSASGASAETPDLSNDGAAAAGASAGSPNGSGTGASNNQGSETPSACKQDCSKIQVAACQRARCNEATGQCDVLAGQEGQSCTPANACEVAGTCDGGTCKGTAKDCSSAASNSCQTGACDTNSGEYYATEVPNGTLCDAGDACISGSTCTNGLCGSGTLTDCSDWTTGCLVGICDSTTGSCGTVSAAAGATCDLPGLTTCQAGSCTASGVCEVINANDGETCADECIVGGTCSAGECAGGTLDQACLAGGATISGSMVHTCTVRPNHTLWCWGDNDDGQLGLGDTTDRSSPTQVGTDADWTSVAVGGSTWDYDGWRSCATRLDGSVWCWGSNESGQLGDGTTIPSTVPIKVGNDTDWVKLVNSSSHVCALKADGSIWCWGWNVAGELGRGTFGKSGSDANPQMITDVGPFRDVETRGASAHTCAIKLSDKSMWCWGAGTKGVLGNGDEIHKNVATAVAGTHDWEELGAGIFSSYGIDTAGKLWSWGFAGFGALGFGSTMPDVSTPQQLGSATWQSITAGNHACGIQSNGSLWCWGSNSNGNLGIGTTQDKLTPIQVGTATNWMEVGIGTNHTCARNSADELWCWGLNNRGQVGNGSVGGFTSWPSKVF